MMFIEDLRKLYNRGYEFYYGGSKEVNDFTEVETAYINEDATFNCKVYHRDKVVFYWLEKN